MSIRVKHNDTTVPVHFIKSTIDSQLNNIDTIYSSDENGNISKTFEQGYSKTLETTSLPTTINSARKEANNFKIYGNSIENYEPTNSNLFGGIAFKNKILELSPASTISGDSIKISPSTWSGKTIYDNFKPNTQYTIIWYGRNSSASYGYSNVYIKYTDGTNKDTVTFTKGELNYSIYHSRSGKTMEKIYGAYSGGSTVLYPNQCGIFEGIIELEDFEAYVGKKRIDSCGDKTVNLFEGIDKMPYILTYPNTDTKKLIADDVRRTYYIPCEPNTKYTIMCDNTDTRYPRFWVAETSETEVKRGIIFSQKSYSASRGAHTHTFTTNADSKFILFWGNLIENDLSLIKNLQFNLGDSMPYEPYGYKIPIISNNQEMNKIFLTSPLKKLSTYSDYIDYKTQKLHKIINEITLTGNEVWSFDIDNNTFITTDILPNIDATVSLLSDIFNDITFSNDALIIKDDNFTTLEDFTTFLANNNPKVIYKLNEEIIENITIPKLLLAKNNNEINVNTQVKPSKLDITYKDSTK